MPVDTLYIALDYQMVNNVCEATRTYYMSIITIYVYSIFYVYISCICIHVNGVLILMMVTSSGSEIHIELHCVWSRILYISYISCAGIVCGLQVPYWYCFTNSSNINMIQWY